MSNDGRADPCAACGLCCRSYLVPLFGHDVHRLVTKRGLSPRSFLFFCRQDEPDKVGIRLERDGPTFGLGLDKKEKRQASQPCTFLVEGGDGTSACGVYEDRPAVCRAYPMGKGPQGLFLPPSALCPPGAWGEGEAGKPSWLTAHRHVARLRDTYVEVVSRWNAWVDALAGPAHAPDEFIDYLLEVQGRIACLDDGLGEPALAEVERTWATLPAGGPRTGVRQDEPAWIGYLRAARAGIDAWHPEFPPLPFARITLERPGVSAQGTV